MTFLNLTSDMFFIGTLSPKAIDYCSYQNALNGIITSISSVDCMRIVFTVSHYFIFAMLQNDDCYCLISSDDFGFVQFSSVWFSL